MLINSLGLKNFKCFEELDVKFAPITLLTGANSSGKSSLINSILAVLQTEEFPYYVSPNGSYVNLGSFEEMVKDYNVKNKFEINISVQRAYGSEYSKYSVTSVRSCWRIGYVDRMPLLNKLVYDDSSLKLSLEDKGHTYDTDLEFELSKSTLGHYSITSIQNRLQETAGIVSNFNTRHNESSFKINNLKFDGNLHPSDILSKVENISTHHIGNTFFEIGNSFSTDFNYLSSFRLPPSRTYYRQSKSNFKVASSGEGYIDQVIDWEEQEPQKLKELLKTTKQLQLLEDIKAVKFKSGRFELNIKTHKKGKRSSLTDVGFGISQFLPIIVADFQLSERSCLAISQPEIHLHPKIQATFGNYLANQVKRTEKQYIVETHSEYLLNRIRLLLTTGELKPEDVRVLYFENDGVRSTVHDVEFATDGQIKGAPAGFFDTYGIDIMDIAMNAH